MERSSWNSCECLFCSLLPKHSHEDTSIESKTLEHPGRCKFRHVELTSPFDVLQVSNPQLILERPPPRHDATGHPLHFCSKYEAYYCSDIEQVRLWLEQTGVRINTLQEINDSDWLLVKLEFAWLHPPNSLQ